MINREQPFETGLINPHNPRSIFLKKYNPSIKSPQLFQLIPLRPRATK